MNASTSPFGRIAASRRHDRHTWAIVLAGGDGVRLRPLVRQLFGDERPKQFAPLMGPGSLLRQTLDRVARLVPRERTVVVSRTDHAPYIATDLAGSPAPRVLYQPENRGTGAGVLFPAHWIQQRAADATVVVFPSDHFILEERAFMAHTAEVVAFVDRHPEWLVLLGAEPTEPESEYGWINPGDRLGQTRSGPIRRVLGFWEKPDANSAQACLATGWLWNTFVFVAKVSRLIAAGQELLPALHERLAKSCTYLDTEHEAWALRQAYALAPTCNFSRSILEDCPPYLAVSQLPRLTWSDLGTAPRVFATLRTANIRPPWLRGALRPSREATAISSLARMRGKRSGADPRRA
jgi:mannose-1-phosphate guanylyltransferase